MARTKRPCLPTEKERAICLIREDSSRLHIYATQYRDDVEFVLALISTDWMCRPMRASAEQQCDWTKLVLEWAADRFCQEESLARQVVKTNWRALAHCSLLWADRTVVLGAVRLSDGAAFDYAADELKADRAHVIDAARICPSVWRFVAAELRADREFSMAMLEATHFGTLEFMADEYKADRDIISAAVQDPSGGMGMNLKLASNQLRADFDIVMLALQSTGSALEFASEDLRSNREIVLAAVQNSGRALLFCTNSSLLADREVVLSAVSDWGYALEVASDDLKNDRYIVRRAIQNSLCALRYASDELKADPDLGLLAIQSYPNNLEFVTSEKLKGDKEVALMALQREINVFQYLTVDLQNDLDVVYKAMWKDCDIFRYDYWDPDPTKGQMYCHDVKARIGSLARAVLCACDGDKGLCRDSPTAFAEDWKVAIEQRHAMLFRQTIDNTRLPREVQALIYDFSEAHYAQELLTCEPFIELLVEKSYDPDYDWLQALRDSECF